MKVALILCCLSASLFATVSSARILAMFGFSSKSHNNVFSALTSELALRGHDVTVVTPYPIKNPPEKYRQIDLPEVYKSIEALDTMGLHTKSYVSQFWTSWDLMGSCAKIVEVPEIKNLLNEKFDLIINSIIFNECTMPFSYHNKAPLILISPSSSLMWNSETMGNPEPSSYVPSIMFPYSDHMNFYQRATNAFATNLIAFLRNVIHLPRMNAVARDFFGEDIPSIQELERNASLAILNNHVSLNYPRPLLPNVIEAGGMHNKKKLDPLPKVRKLIL